MPGSRPARTPRRPRIARLAVAAALAVVVGAAGCTSDTTAPEERNSPTEATEVFPVSQVEPLVAGVTQRTVKSLDAPRLADDLVPPTNRWFSGLVFGPDPQPVFPLPLSFGLTDAGFAFGLPRVAATEKTITGGYQPDLTVTTGAKSATVSAYDTLSVTLDQTDGAGRRLGQATIAQGSPYVSYRAAVAGEVNTPLPFTEVDGVWTAQAGPTTYGMVVNGGTVEGGTIRLDEGGTATWFAVPEGGSAARLAELAEPVTGTFVSHQVRDDEVVTTLTYGSAPTAFASLPHQQSGQVDGADCGLGRYAGLYGTMQVCAGTELSWTSPVVAAIGELDLGSLDEAQRQQLTAQVSKDVADLPAFPADTYFGGKALYRAAMLYRLATQLELDDAAAAVKGRLSAELTTWTEPQGCRTRTDRCFVYDAEGKGLVGLVPSFGSEEYNDHHFHYGYFLFAAGVLGADDPALVERWAPVMDLLAADIASLTGNQDGAMFPDRRVFDAYAGHSWAAGTAPFADGNNQESSSEAVTAWTGLGLWAQATDNAALEAEATWMRSNEAQAGLAYWTNFDQAQPVYAGYGHSIVALNWGGKRDYATWFSPEPAAMLGILLIPMSPVSTYLAGDPARIEANVVEATGGRFDQQFGDYLLMYSALAGDQQRQAALAEAQTLDDKWIDNGNSRSYLLAWLMVDHSS